jgi:hypothetical protein
MPRPSHLDFITRTIVGKQYRSWSSSLRSFLHSPVTSSLLKTQVHSYFYGVKKVLCSLKKCKGNTPVSLRGIPKQFCIIDSCTYSSTLQALFLFQGNSCYANAPLCYVDVHCLSCYLTFWHPNFFNFF